MITSTREVDKVLDEYNHWVKITPKPKAGTLEEIAYKQRKEEFITQTNKHWVEYERATKR